MTDSKPPECNTPVPTWKWCVVAAVGWQVGLGLLVFAYRSDLWAKPALLLPLAVTWELGGLAALALDSVLPKRAEEEAGFRLFLLCVLMGAVAQCTYFALQWEGWITLVRILLLGPLGGGGAAVVSGMFASIFLEAGFKKTVTGIASAMFTSKATLGRIEATREHIWRVVEARFGVGRDQVPADVKSAVGEAADLKQVSQWFESALTAESVEAFWAAVVPGVETRASGI